MAAPGGITGAVTIPTSVTSIGNSAFYYCSRMTAVTIPTSVTSIGDRAFWGCSGLTAVTIPASVMNIGWSAFDRCAGLTELNFLGAPPQLGGYLSDSSTAIVKYPKGSGATTWVNYVGRRFGDLITQEST